MKPEEMHNAVKDIFKEQAQKAFDLGWNTALITVATQIETMKALGDTATSFAAFIKEYKRDDTQ
jgi:hypothetical protein